MPHKRWWQKRVMHECNDCLNHWMPAKCLRLSLGTVVMGTYVGRRFLFIPELMARRSCLQGKMPYGGHRFEFVQRLILGQTWTSVSVLCLCLSGLNSCCLLFSDTFLLHPGFWSCGILFRSCLNHIFHQPSLHHNTSVQCPSPPFLPFSEWPVCVCVTSK